MATDFDNKMSVKSPLYVGSKTLGNLPLDARTRVETLDEIAQITYPFVGMLIYVIEEDAFFVVKSLKGEETRPGIAMTYIPDYKVDTYEKLTTGGGAEIETATEDEIIEIINNVWGNGNSPGGGGVEDEDGPKELMMFYGAVSIDDVVDPEDLENMDLGTGIEYIKAHMEPLAAKPLRDLSNDADAGSFMGHFIFLKPVDANFTLKITDAFGSSFDIIVAPKIYEIDGIEYQVLYIDLIAGKNGISVRLIEE